jgi:hypothetical protein
VPLALRRAHTLTRTLLRVAPGAIVPSERHLGVFRAFLALLFAFFGFCGFLTQTRTPVAGRPPKFVTQTLNFAAFLPGRARALRGLTAIFSLAGSATGTGGAATWNGALVWVADPFWFDPVTEQL